MDWSTWSPFQSASVKQICDHMTDSERLTAMQRGGLYGVWVAGTFAIPVGVLAGLGWLQIPASVDTIIGIAIAITLIVIHICCIPAWLRAQRRFLSSTQWAREQGLQPADLHLFASRNSTG
jgi:hypothetical protein